VTTSKLFLFPVQFFRRLELRFRGFEGFPIFFNGAEETRFITFVAGGAILFDLNEQTIAVAIERDLLDGLGIPAFFALHPKFLA